MLCQPQDQQKYLVSDKVSRTEHWHNNFPSPLIQHSGSQSLDKFLGYCEATSLYTAHLLCLRGSSTNQATKPAAKLQECQRFFPFSSAELKLNLVFKFREWAEKSPGFNQDSLSDNLSYGANICGDTVINGAAQPCEAATKGW